METVPGSMREVVAWKRLPVEGDQQREDILRRYKDAQGWLLRVRSRQQASTQRFTLPLHPEGLAAKVTGADLAA